MWNIQNVCFPHKSTFSNPNHTCQEPLRGTMFQFGQPYRHFPGTWRNAFPPIKLAKHPSHKMYRDRRLHHHDQQQKHQFRLPLVTADISVLSSNRRPAAIVQVPEVAPISNKKDQTIRKGAGCSFFWLPSEKGFNVDSVQRRVVHANVRSFFVVT